MLVNLRNVTYVHVVVTISHNTRSTRQPSVYKFNSILHKLPLPGKKNRQPILYFPL